jgi:hypothetical protein
MLCDNTPFLLAERLTLFRATHLLFGTTVHRLLHTAHHDSGVSVAILCYQCDSPRLARLSVTSGNFTAIFNACNVIKVLRVLDINRGKIGSDQMPGLRSTL